MKFPVFDFGLVHFTSQPYMWSFESNHAEDIVVYARLCHYDVIVLHTDRLAHVVKMIPVAVM